MLITFVSLWNFLKLKTWVVLGKGFPIFQFLNKFINKRLCYKSFSLIQIKMKTVLQSSPVRSQSHSLVQLV
jgi:hypothetical protein